LSSSFSQYKISLGRNRDLSSLLALAKIIASSHHLSTKDGEKNTSTREIEKLTGDTRVKSFITFIRKSEEMQKITRTTSASRSYSAKYELLFSGNLKNSPFPIVSEQKCTFLLHIEGSFVEFLQKSKFQCK